MTDLILTQPKSRKRESAYRKMVLASLRPMKHGTLVVKLPDGTAMTFGDGSNPRGAKHGLHATIRIRSEKFFRRCVLNGDIGFAESYVHGEWDTRDLAAVISWFILNADHSPSQSASRAEKKILGWLGWADRMAHALRANDLDRSRENIAAHYDLSNEFFSLFLDDSMTYSSALFRHADQPLGDAQTEKYDRLCRILQLRAGDRVLEIGGGWGAFSRFAASRYGCHVTSITISKEQYAHAEVMRKVSGLEDLIDLRLADYRTLTGQYDKIVSIEMLEAVGHEYLDTYFAQCNKLLAPNGLLALQVITCPDSRYERMRRGVDFIQKHIFPGGQILSIGAMLQSIGRTSDLLLRDLHDLGDSYAKTLEIWNERFTARLEEVRQLGFDDGFVRKWHYYLMYCMAAFRMRHISAVQMLLTRPNNHSIEAAV